MRLLLISFLWFTVSSTALAAPKDEDVLKSAADRGMVSQLTVQLYGAKEKAGDKATELITQAMGLLGVPYKRGGSSEESGFDCSGFVRHLYEKSVGRLLPHRAEEQARSTEVIDRNELQPGDLVFFNTMKRTFSHVGIYLGDDKFIHSPRTGKSVKVEDMRSAYWQKRFNGARRVPLDSDLPKP